MVMIPWAWEIIKIMIILGTLGFVGSVVGIAVYYFKCKAQDMERLHQVILSNPQFKEDLDEILEENDKKKRKFAKEEADTYKVVSFRKYIIKNASKYSTELTKEELKAYYKAYNQYLKDYEHMLVLEDNEEDFSERIQGKILFKKFSDSKEKDSDK